MLKSFFLSTISILFSSAYGNTLTKKEVAGQKKIYYVTSHGMAANHRVYTLFAPHYYYKNIKIINKQATIFHPIITFDYDDSWVLMRKSKHTSWLKKQIARLIRGWYFKSSLGQYNDITKLSNTIKKYIKEDNAFVVQGISRGASVIIPFLALHPELPIAAVILESPFGHIDHVLNNIVKKSFVLKCLAPYKHALLTAIFKKHVLGKYQPINYAPMVPQEVPILIVTSTSDRLVPAESSIELYQALKNSGHKKVHLLVLDHGKHGFLIQGKDQEIYTTVVHAFYKKYNLPHDPSKAAIGEKYLQ